MVKSELTQKKELKTYEVEISRGVMTVESITVKVQAENPDAAERKAERKAKLSKKDDWRDCTWDDGSKWNYQLEGISEVKES